MNKVYIITKRFWSGMAATGGLIIGVFESMAVAECCKARMMKETRRRMAPCSFSVLEDGTCRFEADDRRTEYRVEEYFINEDRSRLGL